MKFKEGDENKYAILKYDNSGKCIQCGSKTSYVDPIAEDWICSFECQRELYAICNNSTNDNSDSKPESKGDISDGYHTFNELYHHRMILFAVICNVYDGHAWKSWLHHDGTMYDNYFIVGVDTPAGQYSYHYHKDNWNYFNVIERPKAPEWDGHEPKDIERLLSLNELAIRDTY